MSRTFPYRITQPPQAVRKVRLDNIALVPASLLTQKGRYQTIANNLPGQGVLICQTDRKNRITPVLERVAALYWQHGHTVKTLPSSLFL